MFTCEQHSLFVSVLGAYFFLVFFLFVFLFLGCGGTERLPFSAGGADYQILQL